jgi:hypothetical protein
MNPTDRDDYEAVLARIEELEAANAQLSAENDALRAPERSEEEPPPRTVVITIKPWEWAFVGGSGLVLLVLALVQACNGGS